MLEEDAWRLANLSWLFTLNFARLAHSDPQPQTFRHEIAAAYMRSFHCEGCTPSSLTLENPAERARRSSEPSESGCGTHELRRSVSYSITMIRPPAFSSVFQRRSNET